MAWIYIIMAGLLEIVWVIGLKYSHGFTKIIPSTVTVVIIIFSFFLLSKALHSIPLGTGYAIFTGLGTVGTVVTGMLFLGETINPLKVFFMALMILGIIGIKVTPAQPKH
ncbi:DMT family transporter [Peribacillus simplex]|uniref:Ligand-binding protein SH3 n=2 Tax=Peribacillus simplex TaxID=1478 RepID=A0A223ECX0_9BACI|nr:multidrug efflux SMR transporter [Peribacillus simplex]ASS93094.1 ligand-binding protein SH3 [Peribacillus simplex NBRC 15720 = DSM 1321]MEC1400299.1 multidrug efflux SMR transporter [Peribacillus simplex]MED3912302.1 multidrug efflux SMR transporter [Peribacillus simplex]TVX78587.1 multidrug efflux SMR transporter [Peribacillus simplex]